MSDYSLSLPLKNLEKLCDKNNPFATPEELIPSLYMIVLLLMCNAWKQETSLSLHVASITRLQFKESYTFASLLNTRFCTVSKYSFSFEFFKYPVAYQS